MRPCAVLLRAYGGSAVFTATPLFLAAARGGNRSNSPTKRRATRRSRSTATAAVADPSASLASFVPAIAATWMAAASSKMLQPQHVAPDSRKLVWWSCPSCRHQFTKRIDLHVAAGGVCPKCHAKPSPLPASTTSSLADAGREDRLGQTKAVAHRSRPSSSQTTLAAENANRIKKSVADDSYLRRGDKRKLMPMLAKNYSNESAKILEKELIAVSPKLDGIRCITAYDKRLEKILFFSRAGTLFECCDAKIEPYLRTLFEVDPSLVLDGELYNDSTNLHRMAQLLSTLPAKPSGQRGAAANQSVLSLLLEEITRVNPALPKTYFTASASASHGSGKRSGGAAEDDGEEVISFDQLTSAIRATRDRRTPQHEALQRKLQYHIFDLLYCREYPTEKDSQPFRVRYNYLSRLLRTAHEENGSGKSDRLLSSPHALPYDPRVLRLVPSVFCTKPFVDDFLRGAMAVGYEGVMIRRDGLQPSDGVLTLPTSGKAPSTGPVADHKNVYECAHEAQAFVRDSLASSPAKVQKGSGKYTGGYGYGQRSSTLLKYKLMQDAEFIIVSAVEGKGKWAGCLGAFVCQTADKKRTFTVTPASTDEQKRKMWATWKTAYKGKALTVQYQELTSDGVPRFPVGKGIRGSANGKDWI